MKLSKAIAFRLKSLREKAGLSQQDVAMRADLSLSFVAKLEQGKKADPRTSTLLALATALGVRPGELIEDLVPPPAPVTAAVTEPAAVENGAAEPGPDGVKPAKKGKRKKKKTK